MLDGARHYLQLQRLQKIKRRTHAAYAKDLKKARDQKKDRDELEHIRFNEQSEIDFVNDEIATLHTRYLLDLADKYLLPKPDFDDGEKGVWVESRITGYWQLSPETMVKLRTAIRSEQKNRRDIWLGVLTLLIGLVGALAALVSVWKK